MGLKTLFPTPFSVGIFVGYMALFVNQGILITGSKNAKNKYSYNTTTVVLLTETLKLILAVGLFVRSHSLKKYISEAKKHKKMLLFYMVPAFLYCLYNNLTFINLSNYDPTSYFLLLQFRVVVTGVVFQILFKKKLSRMQWVSLFILTAGCVIKEWGNSHGRAAAPPPLASDTSSTSGLSPITSISGNGNNAAPSSPAVFIRDLTHPQQQQIRRDIVDSDDSPGLDNADAPANADNSQRRTKRVDALLEPSRAPLAAGGRDDGGVVAMVAAQHFVNLRAAGNDAPVVPAAPEKLAGAGGAVEKDEKWLNSLKDNVITTSSLQSWLTSFDPSTSSKVNIFFFLILVQVFCSCFAGVYNEYLLKNKGSDLDVQMQNSFMYINSIICNIVALAFTGQLSEAVSPENVAAILSFRVFPIILNNALIGIVTSLFLKTLDSIVKVFASALELLFTAILSWMIFGISIDVYTVIAIGLVSFAIYVYSKNPVQNPPAATALPVNAPKSS